jgi:hypothetical protein
MRRMRIFGISAVAALAALTVSRRSVGDACAADDNTATITRLEHRIAELEARLRAVESCKSSPPPSADRPVVPELRGLKPGTLVRPARPGERRWVCDQMNGAPRCWGLLGR